MCHHIYYVSFGAKQHVDIGSSAPSFCLKIFTDVLSKLPKRTKASNNLINLNSQHYVAHI